MTASNTKATDIYKRENYDTITFKMMKGDKEKIKAHCKLTGEAYQQFLRRAVIEQIERDRNKYLKGKDESKHLPDGVKINEVIFRANISTLRDQRIPTFQEFAEYYYDTYENFPDFDYLLSPDHDEF